MMKKFYIILIVILTAITLCLVACGEAPPKQFSVTYTATEGGYIKGNETQTITFGEDAEPVTAVPFDGYRFVRWSDNDSIEPQRTELDVQKEVEAVAEFAKMSVNVRYRPHTIDEHDLDFWILCGGYIEGNIKQTLNYGDDAAPVVAKANAGYVFADWSDGFTDPERHDKKLTKDLTVSVRFVRTTQTFTYEYNGATDNNTDVSVAITWNKLREISFVVPEKDGYNFQGWFLDMGLTRKAANHAGQSLMGNEILLNNEGRLYAKWTSSDVLVYPVLLIFATETRATLTSNYKRSETSYNTIYDFGIEYEIEVDYKMSEIERKICGLIAPKLAEYLNEMLEGIITFEVDTYFTTEVLENKHINPGSAAEMRSCIITTYDILEVVPYLSHYRTVMNTFGMGDNSGLLHSFGGTSGAKYSSCYMESIFSAFYVTGYAIENLYDEHSNKTNPLYIQRWDSIMGHYIHEFIHTVELLEGIVYDYHLVPNGLGFDKLYLRNEYIVDGKPKGIPYSFWTGEGLEILVNYTVNYDRHYGDRGTVASSDDTYNNFNNWAVSKHIPFGSNSAEVTAIPNEGFRFVKWSDGVTTPTRQDKNVTSLLQIFAIFERV